MSTKKKIWIIVVAIIVFTALGTGALALQNAFLNNEESGSSLIPIGIELSSSSISEENTSSENESNFSISSVSPSQNQSSASLSTGSTESNREPSESSIFSTSSTSSVSSTSESQGIVTFSFIDTVNGKTILSCNFPCPKSGATVGSLTEGVLKQNKILYSVTGAGATIYFESIAGLSQFGAGPNSGWIFGYKRAGDSSYTRSTVGAGGITLYPGDSIEWRYMENGL